MASNFRISVRQKGSNLYLNLTGDFDASSALDVLNAVKNNRKSVSQVFIYTNGLKTIYPFGWDVFQKNLSALKGKSIRFLFAGKYATKIAQEKNKDS